MEANEKIAYGKLFNDNARLTGRLEEAERKLAEFGIQWDGEQYDYDGPCELAPALTGLILAKARVHKAKKAAGLLNE